MKSKLLFHICCSTCFLSYLDLLKDYELVIFYYNPNTYPQNEFEKRLNDVKNICKMYNLQLIIPKYDFQEFLALTKGHEQDSENGKRCEICFKLRLERTAKEAKEYGFTHFSTTLNLSPYKNIGFINKISQSLAANYNLNYVFFDLNKKERFQLLNKTKEKSKELNFYRQKYCGCNFSKK